MLKQVENLVGKKKRKKKENLVERVHASVEVGVRYTGPGVPKFSDARTISESELPVFT